MSVNSGILSCCRGEVKRPPMRIWRKPPLVSKLVKHRDGVNMLCSSTTAQPPPTHTHTHPSSTTIPKHSPFRSWVNLQSSGGGELGPDFSAVEEPGGPRDTQVTSIESCSISRAQWNNSLPSGTYVKAILALQRSITLTSIKCYLFSIFIHFFLCLQISLSHVVLYALNALCQIQSDG